MTTTDYDLCIYDTAGLKMTYYVPAGGMCGTKPCWRVLGTQGFKYRNRLAAPTNLEYLLLRAGGTEKGHIAANPPPHGAPANLPMLPLTTPVLVQLQQDSSRVCWEATYNNAKVDTASAFMATSD
jgi:hypothetical protein